MIHLPDEDNESIEVFSSPCSAPPIEPVPEVPFAQQETPAQPTPAQDAPVQDAPVQDTSSQDALVQEEPAQQPFAPETASPENTTPGYQPASTSVEPAPAFAPQAIDDSAPEISSEDTVPAPAAAYENVVPLPLPEAESRQKSFDRQAEDSFRMAIGGNPKVVDGIVSAASESYQTVALAVRASAEEWMTGVTRINTRLFEFGQLNAQSSLDFMRAISGVRNVQDAVDMQTAYLRGQCDTMASQLRELQTLTTEVAGKATQPFKDQFTRAAQLGRMC